jgi:hypothetical protein
VASRLCNDAANNLDLVLNSDTSVVAPSGLVPILASVDLATGSAHPYLNDTEDLGAGGTHTNDTIDWTRGDLAIGAEPDAHAKLPPTWPTSTSASPRVSICRCRQSPQIHLRSGETCVPRR